MIAFQKRSAKIAELYFFFLSLFICNLVYVFLQWIIASFNLIKENLNLTF